MKMIEAKDFPTSLAELEELRTTWQARRNEAQARLAELEAESGRRLLAGDSSVRQELATTRAELQEAEQVLREITRQEPLAKAVSHQERARKMRAEAKELEAEAARIEAETGPLLDQIEALEGCRFVPPAAQSRFGSPSAKSVELRIRAGKMKDQAEDLDYKAGELVKNAGKVSTPEWGF